MARGKIKVHEKALAHLSRGLYRSPASALRELVSNAWDANATTVHLSMNYPNFLQVAVEDNGEGFTREEFKTLMEGGIGNSAKRETQRRLIGDRPLIGKLGIGMLGIAQMCGAFTVTSKPRRGKPFQARVTLYDLLRERLDASDQTVVKTVSENLKEVDVGEYEFNDADLGETQRGTTIIADDVHPTFVRAFQEATSFKEFQPPPLDWRRCIALLHKRQSVHELGDYWRLLWELAAATPVPYTSSRALPRGLIAADQERLSGYNFKVFVDGRQLFKPVELRNNPSGYTTLNIEPQSLPVYERPLRFHGYIVVQEGSQIRPDELRGLLVRIRNVAVGYYDPSLLDYRVNQGPRSRWITGEIFVDEGLEDALNIDRDSFNRFHPQFRALQAYVHQRLSEDIFPDVYKNIVARSAARAGEKKKERAKRIRSVLAEAIEKPVRLREVSREPDGRTPRVHLTETRNAIQLEMPAAETIPTKKTEQQLANAILAFFELALRERSRDKQREVFAQLLVQFLKAW